MERLPNYNAADLDTLLTVIKNAKSYLSIKSIQKEIPTKNVYEIDFMIKEINTYKDGLLETKPYNYGDETILIYAGPLLQDFLLLGGFQQVFKSNLDYKIQLEKDIELDRKSKQATIDAAFAATEANKHAKKANFIAWVSIVIALTSLALTFIFRN